MITENAVTSDEVEINAPVELVWNILVDFDNYGKWNKFCPQIINKSLEPGAAVEMLVELGNGLQQQTEYISLIEPNEAIAWSMANKSGDPIHATRTQTLTKLSDTRCSYISVDDFSGEGVPVMIELMGKPVETGFNWCAYGLKQYAEALFGNGES